jgi:2,4-dienoyl-CoA reductase-like NADH-dependent reductase (Old Yellow Enzyme family)
MTDIAQRELLSARPFSFPCGARSKNRFFKAAMSETLAAADCRIPVARVERLYGAWAVGGAGVVLTGNVMIDRNAIGEPGNIVIEDRADLAAIRAWAAAGTIEDTQLWMQLNHPGKQAPRGMNKETVAPSSIPFSGEMGTMFSVPRELSEQEILRIIERFATTATLAQEGGFTGVQIHGAHGYLVSQFLSPKHNQRTDRWGGSAENRRRFALEIYRAIRAACGKQFAISIKLNSADFQRGGFTEQESVAVMSALADEGIDLIEISGGTYESAAMMGASATASEGNSQSTQRTSTQEREAYFLAFAATAREQVKCPIVVTGGFRSLAAMEHALRTGQTDMIGLARPLAVDPALCAKLLSANSQGSTVTAVKTGIRWFDQRALPEITYYETQLHRIADGLEPLGKPNGLRAMLELARYGLRNLQGQRRRA